MSYYDLDPRYVGLGDAGQVPIAEPAITTAISAGAPIGIAAATGASLAVPVIGAGIAAVTLAIGLFFNRKGPQQKIQTTQAVNTAETYMKQNLAAWESSSKNSAEQQQAIANYWNLWNQIVSYCSQDSEGAPGRACIQDRMASGTTITAPNGKTYTGDGMYDYQAYYLDPIQNYTPSDSTAGVSNTVSSIFSSITSGGSGMLIPIIGLLGIGGLFLLSSKD